MAKLGEKLSIETKQKMRLARLGKPRVWSEEGKRSFSEKMKGHEPLVYTQELREKMSIAQRKRFQIHPPWNKGKTTNYKGERHHWFGRNASGENNPAWKMDRSKLAKAGEHRNDSAHHDWSKNVKNRDGWRCRIADDNCSGRLEAHHILSYKEYPELRYQLNNGITLCHAHHPRRRAEEKRLSPYFQSLVSVSNKLP